MKEIIKNNKSIIIFLTVVTFCILFSAKSYAAENSIRWVEDDITKVGDYYFQIESDKSDNEMLYCAKSKNGKRTLLVKTKNELNSNIVVKGTKVYYVIDKQMYTIEVDGKNNKKFQKLKGNEYNPEAIYNNILYYFSEKNSTIYSVENSSKSDSGDCYLYSLSLSTKKNKCINLKFDAVGCLRNSYSSSRYIYVYDGGKYGAEPEVYPDIKLLRVFDCKTEKVIYSIKNVHERHMFKINGKFYYASKTHEGKDGTSEKDTFNIYKSDLNGKNRKLIKTIKTHCLGEINYKYIYYANDSAKNDQYYRYNIKTKKSEKITEKQFKFAGK